MEAIVKLDTEVTGTPGTEVTVPLDTEAVVSLSMMVAVTPGT